MDIRLLGPLEALADDGSPLPVTAPVLRAVLAALALRTGEAVSSGSLEAQLWRVPPRSARSALRTHISRLRRALPGGRIRTVPAGYLLAAGPEETDLGRFRARLARARARAAAAPEQAVADLEGALALWRGAPLSGLGDRPLRAAERPRLEELYLTAVEERFELKLGLGEHAAVVGELTEAAEAHPRRERLLRQLTLALARCDRAAGAQTASRGGGAADHRGASRETRVPQGAPSAAVSLPEAPACPPGTAAFPPAIATFVARGVELARVRGWLADAPAAPAVCLIDGPGGVGKSTLAVRAAREVADRFPDGLLYVDLRGADPRNPPLEIAEARCQLLSALGTAGKDVPADPALAESFYHEQLSGRRVLVLLDNALDARQAAPLIPAEPGSAALITSRAVLTGVDGGHHLHLSPLSSGDAVALVQTITGGSGGSDAPGGVAGPGLPADWEELARLCGYLPLALRIVATRMAARPRWSVTDWTAMLRDERRRMDELTADDLDLRASLMVGMAQLAHGTDPADRLAATLFPLLGSAAVLSHTSCSAAALAGCAPRSAAAALDRLADAQIAASPRPGVYTLHDLVRAAAAWQAARLPQQQVRARLADLARWYLGSLFRMNTPLALPGWYRTRYREGADRYPQGRLFTSADESLPWADENLEDTLALAGQFSAPEYDQGDELAGQPLSAFALESLRALETYFGMRLSWRAQRRLCDLALAVGRRRGDVFMQAVAYGQLGKALGQRGEGLRGVEMLERSVALFRSVGEREEAVGAMTNLVPCLGSAGRLTEALHTAERTLAEARETGMEDLRIPTRNNLGRCHLYLGNHAEARSILMENYRCTTYPYERTMAAGVLAEYHLEIGEFEEAARWSGRALNHAAEQPFDPFVVAQQRTWLAAALRGLGREDRARAEEMQARAALEELNSRENSHLRVRVEEKYSTT